MFSPLPARLKDKDKAYVKTLDFLLYILSPGAAALRSPHEDFESFLSPAAKTKASTMLTSLNRQCEDDAQAMLKTTAVTCSDGLIL